MRRKAGQRMRELLGRSGQGERVEPGGAANEGAAAQDHRALDPAPGRRGRRPTNQAMSVSPVATGSGAMSNNSEPASVAPAIAAAMGEARPSRARICNAAPAVQG